MHAVNKQNPSCGGSLDKLKKKACGHTGGTDTKEQLLDGRHKTGITAKSQHVTPLPRGHLYCGACDKVARLQEAVGESICIHRQAGCRR